LVVPYPYKLKDAKWWINKCLKENKQKKKIKNNYNLIIEGKKEKSLIGGIGLMHVDIFQGKAEVGYWLGEKYWREGYGTEALGEVLKFAFNKLKLRRVYADILAGNPSSGKLLEKFGFKKEGFGRKAVRCKASGNISDTINYGLCSILY